MKKILKITGIVLIVLIVVLFILGVIFLGIKPAQKGLKIATSARDTAKVALETGRDAWKKAKEAGDSAQVALQIGRIARDTAQVALLTAKIADGKAEEAKIEAEGVETRVLDSLRNSLHQINERLKRAKDSAMSYTDRKVKETRDNIETLKGLFSQQKPAPSPGLKPGITQIVPAGTGNGKKVPKGDFRGYVENLDNGPITVWHSQDPMKKVIQAGKFEEYTLKAAPTTFWATSSDGRSGEQFLSVDKIRTRNDVPYKGELYDWMVYFGN